MSHTSYNYQAMSDAQLFNIISGTYDSYDKQRAMEELSRRAAAAKDQATRNQQALQQTQQNQRALQRLVNDLQHSNTQLQQVISRQEQQIETAQRQTEQQINRLRTEQQQQLDQVRQEDAKQRAQLAQRISMQIADVKTETAQAIRESEQRSADRIQHAANALNNRITQIHTQLTQDIQDSKNRISQMENNWAALSHSDAQLRQNASEYLEAAVSVVNATVEYNNANNHNWQSNVLTRLRGLQQNVVNDMNEGGMLTVGSARQQARQLFEDALEYRAQVFADEQEWQVRRASALQQVQEAEIELESSRHLELDGMDIDVDYWTCGDLRRIEDRITALRSLIEDSNVTLQDLDNIGTLAETYRQELREAVLFAAKARQFSFDRKELLEEAIEVIQTRLGTLHVEWQEYFAGDERFGYRVYLTSASGERIVLTAEPSPANGELRNSFRFEILSHGSAIRSGVEAQQFMQMLDASLQGLDGCSFDSATCTDTAAPAQDQGQGNQNSWERPQESQVQEAQTQVSPVVRPAPVPMPQPAAQPAALPI